MVKGLCGAEYIALNFESNAADKGLFFNHVDEIIIGQSASPAYFYKNL